MSFFNFKEKEKAKPVAKGYSLELLHQQQCKVCPLDKVMGNRTPHMQPAGSDKPIVYVLGEAPGKNEDQKGVPFIGQAGQLLRSHIPQGWEDRIRWSNCVRTRPPKNRTPTSHEIECCRPSVEKDIERTKPRAIFGFGAVPLAWATKQSGILAWTGRRIPIKIGSHACWFFPLVHPSYIARMLNADPDGKQAFDEFTFHLHLQRAFDQVKDLPPPIVHTSDDALSNIECPDDVDRIVALLREAEYSDGVIGLDYETNCLRPYKDGARILTIAVATADHCFAFPFQHRESKWNLNELGALRTAILHFLRRTEGRKVAHHLSFEMEWSGYFFAKDCLWKGKWGDSISQAYILDERRVLSLDALCLQYFGINLKAISNLDRKNLDQASLDQVLTYNAMDAKYHRLLYIEQTKRLNAEGLMPVYKNHMHRVPTMVLSQLKGIPVDQKAVSELFDMYDGRRAKVEKKIQSLKIAARFRKEKGFDYRPSSLQDTRFAIIDLLGKQDIEKVDEAALSQINHPIAKLTIEWRKANKVVSTYIKPLQPDSPHVYSDGLAHPIISTVKTRTWRTSSEDPNSQNFPKRDEETKIVRKQIARSGYKVVSFDYAGIQARNVAMESRDKALIDAFWSEYDIHADWMERIRKHYPKWCERTEFKENRKHYRHLAKNAFVFPSFFGAQPPKLSKGLDIPKHTCAKIQEEFWATFPDVKGWHESMKRFYERNGYITGLSGFRRRAPVTPNELINAPIQSDESLIVCNAMARLSKIDHDYLQANMEIHDDLTFIWEAKKVDELAEPVIREMLRIEYDWVGRVPLVVEMSVGDDWASGKEVGVFSSVKYGHKRI